MNREGEFALGVDMDRALEAVGMISGRRSAVVYALSSTDSCETAAC